MFVPPPPARSLPLTPEELAPFIAAGCRAKVERCSTTEGEFIPDDAPPRGDGEMNLHFVYGPEGHLVSDWHLDAIMLRDLAARGIFAPTAAYPPREDDAVTSASLGRGANGKWYGWSHRGFASFGVGDRLFRPSLLRGRWADRWRDLPPQQVGYATITTDDEARTAAANFAAWAS